MNEPIAHHLYGPSKLENYDPKSGGCYAFLPDKSENEKAIFGSLKHVAVSTRDLSVLGGDRKAEEEVTRALAFMDRHGMPYLEKHTELTLKVPKIFGTLDFLGLDYENKWGIIIDLKFGAWSVTTARKNLQGWAYVLLAFRNYPWLKKIKMIFYSAKDGSHSEYTFWRYRLEGLEKRIYRIIDQAARAEKTPLPNDYTPNSINCSFCVRLNCPARLALMGTLVTQWTGKPVELPHLNLMEVTTPQLARLKQLSNVFKTFSAAVDNEAKRRAFDSGDVVEGYEIAEKSGPRTIIGEQGILQASLALGKAWDSLEFNPADWGEWLANNTEVSLADLEKEIQKRAPHGKGAYAKKILIDELEKAGLINANRIFFLQAIKE